MSTLSTVDDLQKHLTFLYGEKTGRETFVQLNKLISSYHIPSQLSRFQFSQSDVILITYGDQVVVENQKPLQVLADFCRRWVKGVIPWVHILPFYPYSSDDGFSVINYKAVNPALGNWEDIALMGNDFRLMFDLVLNHASVKSCWFQGFLEDQYPYRDYFITIEGEPDLSAVFRPRDLPLITSFQTPSGTKRVWTTFSTDQADLNYRNPRVLLEMLDTLLFYASHGAEVIRLDAIAYLWKEIGTLCLHLPQTHRVVQLMRTLLDFCAPQVSLITETNVPHEENISYFGDGTNEAQLVYNFAFPPLILHTFHSQDATALTQWASNLRLPSNQVTFFNFLASHDGFGLTPAKGLISPEQIESLVQGTLFNGGEVSFRLQPDGSSTPYELNINFFDALRFPGEEENSMRQCQRFLAAHAILLAVTGVPGIYFHSLFGSRGWREGVQLSGQKRAINRQKFRLTELENELTTPGSRRDTIFSGLKHLIQIRASEPAFHPYGNQQLFNLNKGVFAILRLPLRGERAVLCLTNVRDQKTTVSIPMAMLPFQRSSSLVELLRGSMIKAKTLETLTLQPYQSYWVTTSE